MTYRLGVDGGGTKTVAVLAVADGETWREVGRGVVRGCNRDGQLDVQPIRMAIDQAFAAASVATCEVSYACLALAGAGRDSVVQRVRAWAASESIAARVEVVADVVPLLARADAECCAVAVISGTGSMAWGRCPHELAAEADQAAVSLKPADHDRYHTARAGGLGPLLGDEGSGYWIGLQALQAVARLHDGAAERADLGPTSLTDAVLNRFQLVDLAELPRCAAERTRDEIAAFAIDVLAQWAAGDPLAAEIAVQASVQLAELVVAVARKLSLPRIDHLSVAGGVLVESAQLRSALIQQLHQYGFPPAAVEIVDDPVLLTLRSATD